MKAIIEFNLPEDLDNLFEKLAKKGRLIKILNGLRDSCGGYGWHIEYWIEVYKVETYCPLCKEKDGNGYNGQSYKGEKHNSNCKERIEHKTIFTGTFWSMKEIFKAVSENCL